MSSAGHGCLGMRQGLLNRQTVE